jgi:hypothetical protein
MRILFKSKRIQLLLVIILVLVALYGYIVYEGFIDTKAALCAIGYWCPASSQTDKAAACPGGTYGATAGLISPTCSGKCQAGCFCGEGSTTMCPAPCPAGFYCIEGTFQPAKCPKGNYCPISSKLPIACPTGVYCPEGTASLPGPPGAPGGT